MKSQSTHKRFTAFVSAKSLIAIATVSLLSVNFALADNCKIDLRNFFKNGHADEKEANRAAAERIRGMVAIAGKDHDLSDTIADAARLELKQRDVDYKLAIRTNPNDVELRTANHLIVGGGSHGATAANNARGSTIVFNDSKRYGTFSKFGDVFYVNSLEEPGKLSPNLLPGCNLQTTDFCENYVPEGALLGKVTETNLALSEAEIVNETKLVKLKVIKKDGQVKIVATTHDGVEFHGDDLTLLTGIGKRKFPASDEGTLSVLEKDKHKKFKRITFIDDSMEIDQTVAEAGINPMKRTAGKRIVVVGGGNGGQILQMQMFGHGPPRGYAFQKITEADFPEVSYWAGQKAPTEKAYFDSTWGKYQDVAPYFPKDASPEALAKARIQPVAEKWTGTEEILTGPDAGALRVRFGMPPNERYVIADEIKAAASYDNSGVMQLLNTLLEDYPPGSTIELPFIKGHVPGIAYEVNLGRAVKINGEMVPGITIGGPAAGSLETEGEAGGFDSPRLEALTKRTAELMKRQDAALKKIRAPNHLIHQPTVELVPKPGLKAFVEVKARPSGFRFVSLEDQQQRISNRVIGALRKIKLPSDVELKCKVSAVPSSGRVTFGCENVAKVSVEKIANLFELEPDLIKMLLDHSKRDPSHLDFVIKGTSAGHSTVTELDFKPAL